jgi:hypothetical protein
MSTSDDDTVAVISIPGADFLRIIDHFQNCDINPGVKNVTIHVGVNDVMNANWVSESVLSDITRLIIHKFPNTAIFFSSILPPSYGPQRRMAATLNKAIEHFCYINNWGYINNTPFFTTSSGAPKKNLYKGQIHTSKLGSSFLAKNLKYPERTFEHTTPVSKQEQRNENPISERAQPSNVSRSVPAREGRNIAPVVSTSSYPSANSRTRHYEEEYPPLPPSHPVSSLTQTHSPSIPQATNRPTSSVLTHSVTDSVREDINSNSAYLNPQWFHELM